MMHCYTDRTTSFICREANEPKSPASRAGQGVVILVGHRHLRGRLVIMSRVPIRVTLPSDFDQVIPDRDLGDLGSVSLISRASRANTISSRAIRANTISSRASGGVVTANRAMVSRDRGEEISGVDVSSVARMAIGARIIQREIGPHNSRVSVMSHISHFFQPPSQHHLKYQPYQPSQQLLYSKGSCSTDVSITSTRQHLLRHHPRLRVRFLSMALWVIFYLILGRPLFYSYSFYEGFRIICHNREHCDMRRLTIGEWVANFLYMPGRGSRDW